MARINLFGGIQIASGQSYRGLAFDGTGAASAAHSISAGDSTAVTFVTGSMDTGDVHKGADDDATPIKVLCKGDGAWRLGLLAGDCEDAGAHETVAADTWTEVFAISRHSAGSTDPGFVIRGDTGAVVFEYKIMFV